MNTDKNSAAVGSGNARVPNSETPLLREDLRMAILETAAEQAGTPDPAGSISLERIAAIVGRPLSSVLYQFGNTDAEAAALFRQRVLVRAVQRFVPQLDIETHRTITNAIRTSDCLAQDVAAIADALVEQIHDDPATRFLFAAQCRIGDNPELGQAVEALWSTLATNVIRLIDLVAALRGTRIDFDRADFGSLIRLALAAGWSERNTSDRRSTLCVFGNEMSVSASLLWAGVAVHTNQAAP